MPVSWCTQGLVLVLLSILVSCRANVNQVDETFQLLHEGDVNIQLGDNKNLIVVLGVTGSGKSTLVQFLAGDNSKLIAKRRGFDIIIEDSNKKIGQSTLQSKTLFPELVIDPVSGAAFVDCPGFYDTRNSSIEIATSYFIKKVFDQAKEVKLVFTISQSSFRVGNDRRGLSDLLAYASVLVANINKYKDSIALVVTKVDNYPPMEDLEVIEYIKEFLLEAKEEISSKKEEDRKMVLNKKMVTLLDYLLDDKNGGKIGIFRRPDKQGPLSQSAMLQAGKPYLQNILFSALKYTVTSPNDFSYSLSSDSKLYIKQILINIVDTKIITFLTDLASELFRTYRFKGEKNNNLYSFRDLLISDTNTFSRIQSDLKIRDKLQITISTCMQYVNSTVYHIDQINQIIVLINQASSFKTFIDDHSSEFLILWTKPLNEFIKYLQNLNNWYILLSDISKLITTYDFQKQKQNYINKLYNNPITNENVKTFLARAGDLNLRNFTLLIEITKSDLQIDNFLVRDINSVFSSSLKSDICECRELNKFEFNGNIVLLSDVLVKSRTMCAKPIIQLTINANHTLYIDDSLNLTGRQVQVTFNSPNWVIVGNVGVVVDRPKPICATYFMSFGGPKLQSCMQRTLPELIQVKNGTPLFSYIATK